MTDDPAPPSEPAPVADPTGTPPKLVYPAARRDPLVETLHGTRVPDPYRWLEDVTSPEVQTWMQQQDHLAREHLSTLPHRDAIERRLVELTYIDAIGVPVHRGRRYFYARSRADQEKAVYYVREGKDGPEQVWLDPNALSEDGSVSVQGTSPSRSGRYVAYKLSENNADAATMYVRDLDTGRDLPDVIEGAKYAYASWTPDDRGFYYVRLPTDPAIAPADLPGHAEIRFHRLGTDPATDELVFPALGDPTTFLGAALSDDGHWLLLYKSRGATNEVYVQDRRSKRGRERGFVPLATGFTASYGVDVHQDRFFVTTDEGAPRRRVFAVDPRHLERERWREIVPEHPDAVLDAAYVVGGHLVTSMMIDARSRLQVLDLDGKLVREVELPGLGTASGLFGDPDEDEAYFYFTSYVQPALIYETSVSTGKTSLWASIEVPIDTSAFEERQVWYTSKDGTKVSMFLVHQRGLVLDGSHPTLLGGYGGFNVSMTPGFSASAAIWVERGGVYAVANLRGGGEYGEAWHEAGMRANKQNVFDDFIAAAEYLVAEGYTRPERLGIRGGSNGGLLVGAAMTQRPELFGAVVCEVPLLDMIRYHRFGSGPTWIPEYGDPEDPGDFAFLSAYSPYHRVREGTAYPALLMMSADSDDRVDPMHARKFTAAVQAASTSGEVTIMRIESKAGHGGGGTRKKAVEHAVDTYVFLLDQLAG